MSKSWLLQLMIQERQRESITQASCLNLFFQQLSQECGFQVQMEGEIPLKAGFSFITLSEEFKELALLILKDPKLRVLFEESRHHSGLDPAHDLNHFLRVAKIALSLSQPSKLHSQSIIAAALLHDRVNLKKNDPQSYKASQLSAKVAKTLLTQLEFGSDSEIDEICSAIETHSFSSGLVPISTLGQCLQDADRLDALGAIGLLRLISVGAQLGSALYDPSDPWATQRPLNDKQFTFAHLQVKLFNLPSKMQTEAGRKEAEIRVLFMKEFMREFAREALLPLPVWSHLSGLA